MINQSLHQNSGRNPAVPQNLVRDDAYQPEDTLTRVARCIFCYRYPTLEWSSNLFKAERDDCFLMAAQFKEIFSDKWTLVDAAEKLTEHSVHLVFGTKPITPELRAQVADFAESYLEDLVALFIGDGLTVLKDPTAKGRVQ